MFIVSGSNALAQGPDQGPSLLIQNPDWEIVVTTAGYSDLLFDRREGFRKREFLSGEWAAAVCFDKGGETIPPTWLQKQWIAPDWVSNSDFELENSGAFAVLPDPNIYDFTIFRSSVTNDCLRVTITFEMIDTVVDNPPGIEMGIRPKDSVEEGVSVTSSRYVLKQTYTFENISGQELNNFKFFQFLHGLESATAVYDDRDYGGPFAGYQYDITQEGDSFSFNTLNGDIVSHHDVIGFHADAMPSAYEVGYYGRPPQDDHQVGKPEIGVHLSVEGDSLKNVDFFAPPETRWIGGAQRFELGTIPIDGSVTRDVLLSIQTSFQTLANVDEIEVSNLAITSGNILEIDIVDNLAPPGPIPFGILLFKATELVPFLNENNQINYGPDFENPLWEQVAVPLRSNGVRTWFEVPIQPEDFRCFYAIAVQLDNSPQLEPPGN